MYRFHNFRKLVLLVIVFIIGISYTNCYAINKPNTPLITSFEQSNTESNMLKLKINPNNTGNNYYVQVYNLTLNKKHIYNSNLPLAYQNLVSGKSYSIMACVCKKENNIYICSDYTNKYSAIAKPLGNNNVSNNNTNSSSINNSSNSTTSNIKTNTKNNTTTNTKVNTNTTSVAKKFVFKNKRAFIEGDSIQKGSGKFLEKVCTSLKTKKPKNNAVSKATLANRLGNNSLYYRIVKAKSGSFKNYDIFFISAGVNDYKANKKIGKISSVNKNEVSGALNLIIKRLHKDSPKAKIIVFTPMYDFKRVKDGDKVKNKKGHTLASYRKAIRKVATRSTYKGYVYVINGTDLASKSEFKKKSFDGLHPGNSYAKTIASRAVTIIKKTVK